MRIPCPHCGPRGHEEFDYLADAAPRRPTDGGAVATTEWERYVYIRENLAGAHRELWFHGAGCQSWLVVTRDTRTHEILGAQDAQAAASGRAA